MGDKAILTCALTGVLTDPAQHPVPVTPEQMAQAAKEAWEEGAVVMHVHFRDQGQGRGRFPTWDPDVAAAITDAIRDACPGAIINMTTGVIGPDVSGPIACLERTRPEIAALNAGTLNYLRVKQDDTWAWPPILFDNPVDKIERYAEAMQRLCVAPECECFDTGIVRSVGLFLRTKTIAPPYSISLVMGVESGMPAKPHWLPLLVEEMPRGALWQVIAIGRDEVWELHRRAAELGGNVRTGLEDTFYLPSGERARHNGDLVRALAAIVRETGREPASAAEARALYGLAATR